MIRALAIAIALMFSAPGWAAPNVTGLWLTQDHDGVIEIWNCAGGTVCARIVGVFLDRPDDPMPVDYRGVSQCDLKLISDARQVKPSLWKGHIMDPRNGSVWGVELRLDPSGNLALRGFLGIPLLGQTQTWTRYTAAVPSDCRIDPANAEHGMPEQSVRAQ